MYLYICTYTKRNKIFTITASFTQVVNYKKISIFCNDLKTFLINVDIYVFQKNLFYFLNISNILKK